MGKIDISFTGERMIPGKVDLALLQEHLSRYRFAAGFSEGCKVLDAACGSGYGSFILSTMAKHVTGIDKSEDAIDYANCHFSKEDVDFKTADVLKIPFPDASYDLTVAFEIFEHVDIPQAMLSELKRITRPGGSLIISTPNSMYDKSTVENPFHVREYDFLSFSSIIEQVFPDRIKYFNQHRKSSSESIKRTYVRLKRVLGIGPLVKKPVFKMPDKNELLTMDLPFEITEANIEKAEFFVAVIDV